MRWVGRAQPRRGNRRVEGGKGLCGRPQRQPNRALHSALTLSLPGKCFSRDCLSAPLAMLMMGVRGRWKAFPKDRRAGRGAGQAGRGVGAAAWLIARARAALTRAPNQSTPGRTAAESLTDPAGRVEGSLSTLPGGPHESGREGRDPNVTGLCMGRAPLLGPVR